MAARRSILVSLALSVVFTASLGNDVRGERPTMSAFQVPESCRATAVPESPLIPPAPYPPRAPSVDRFWYGNAGLWTMLRNDGTWRGVPPDRGYRRGYRDKVFWWRPGYDGRIEPSARLTVTTRRIDGDAPTLTVPFATNAHHQDFGGWAMLVALDIPTTGCWEITGRYDGHVVTFVTWVLP